MPIEKAEAQVDSTPNREKEDKEAIEIDNTRRSCHTECPRKYYWSYEKNLVSNRGSTALRFGHAIHAVLEEHYEKGSTLPDEDVIRIISNDFNSDENIGRAFISDWRTVDMGLLTYKAYCKRYPLPEAFSLVGQEEKFKIKMAESIFFTGRVDGVIKLNGGLWALEHKTTAMTAANAARTHHRSAQTIGYAFAMAEIYKEEIEGCIINILQTTGYMKRDKSALSSIKHDFLRMPHIYTETDVENWKISFLHTANAILSGHKELLQLPEETEEEALVSIVNKHYPPQFDACYNYGACPYTELCEQPFSFSRINTSSFQEYIWNPLA